MTTFLIDGENAFDYELLLGQVNAADAYRPLLRTHSLYEYFLNLLTGLAANRSLTLIDSDISDQELSALCTNEVNVSQPVRKECYGDWDSFCHAILTSTSEIAIFTSGTTGQPKKVIHTVGTLTRAVRSAERYKGHIWLFAYNPTHMAGLQVFFQAFANKNMLVNAFNKSRNAVFDLINRYRITHISATPTFYRLLLPADRRFETVQRVTLGGEKSGKSLYDNILKLFPSAKLNNIYASTEAGSLFATKNENFQIPSDILDKCKIIDGELLIHKSLLGKSDSFIYQGDYYNTGDVVEWVDEPQGLFRFASRKNELINVGGYKVNPNEVEEAICQIEGMEQVHVYGKPNSILGNILCAEVVKRSDCPLTEIAVRKMLSGNLQDFKVPRKITFVEHLSLTRTGKLKRTL